MDRLQKAHDLTVALVAATAKEHTAEEYVRLYRQLYETVKTEVERESDEYVKNHSRFGFPDSNP